MPTATPIKHLLVIFQENVSFDHYFATYPIAANPPGEPAFTPLPGTPGLPGAMRIDTLAAAGLLTNNPNRTNPLNGADAALPFRLDISQAATADQDHGYTAEQAAYDHFKMDLFPLHTGRGDESSPAAFTSRGLVMGYYDGNTLQALWNYSQHFAMSDNSFSTTFGPSTPGAINLVSGQTNGVIPAPGAKRAADGTYARGSVIPDGAGGWTVIGDPDPTGDVCSTGETIAMAGPNIGDLLNAAHISWGFFAGGFDLGRTNADGSTGCARKTLSTVTRMAVADYIPHHQPFQYYASTANPRHIRPKSLASIGTSDDGGANHQYDLADFYAALAAHDLPAVSFLKAPAYQDGHAGYSDPLDEQPFLVGTVNALEKSPEWRSTAIIILYDDSDGWYDHAHSVVNPSYNPKIDVLDGDHCGTGTPLAGLKGKPVNGRCGYGTRQPLLVISRFARRNHVDHTLTDQTSIARFIEKNWLRGRSVGRGSYDAIAGSLDGLFDWSRGDTPPLLLNPRTGGTN
ncbi:MAG: phospholipase C [Sphingomonas sp.]